jgi:hypothetical protein
VENITKKKMGEYSQCFVYKCIVWVGAIRSLIIASSRPELVVSVELPWVGHQQRMYPEPCHVELDDEGWGVRCSCERRESARVNH